MAANGTWAAIGWEALFPAQTDTAIIEGLTSPGNVYLDQNNADAISGLTTDNTTNLEVINGSLSLGIASSATIGGSVTVEPGATLNVGEGSSIAFGGSATLETGATISVGEGVSLQIEPGQTLTDNGTLSFATGDNVTLGNCCSRSADRRRRHPDGQRHQLHL